MTHDRLYFRLVLVLAASLSFTFAQDRQRQEEMEDYYRKWLEQDVVWIIGSDERAVFEGLTTGEERDHFIEQFWLRRDPDPRTAENEFKEEHYRRIQYANEWFHAGIPGWRTDRGRIYIMFGPPDRKESYPMGGWYERKSWEGGGQTHVFPFELWEYNYIDGVGTDVELEFVDTGASNLYTLTLDPQEKDEFLTVPGAGLTHREMFHPDFGGRKSVDRALGIRDRGLAVNQGIIERSKDHPFQKAELMMRIARAPAIRYQDLKELVETSVFYRQLPFRVESHSLQIDPDDALVSVTVSFAQSEVRFKETENGRRSHLRVYGLIETMDKRFVTEFDDDIEARYREQEWLQALGTPGVYQRKLALKPGRYKLTLVLKDVLGEKVGSTAAGINVPRAGEELSTSSIILSKKIDPSPTGDLSRPFVVGRYRLLPNVGRVFGPADYLAFYVEIYDFLVDQSTLEPRVQVEYAIAPSGARPEAYRTVNRVTLAAGRLAVARMVQLLEQQPGRYDLYCRVTDQLARRSITTRTSFEIRPE